MKRVFHQKKKELKQQIRTYLEIVEKSGIEIPGLPTRDEVALSEDQTFEQEFGKEED